MTQSSKIVIVGGGVAGMSAAHELIERGFQVEVYEKQPVYVGGKARSVEVPDSASPGKKPLPGEHGFRFFPGFYRHVTDTMKRIPLPDQPGKFAYDNLTLSTKAIQAQVGKTPIIVPANAPRNKAELKQFIDATISTHSTFTAEENRTIFEKLWQMLTSSRERKNDEYERLSWWDFCEADRFSQNYRDMFVIGLTRTLVAAKAEVVSSKTAGNTLLQLMMLQAKKNGRTDQVLNAPTNDAWLWPWLTHLKGEGVNYHHGYQATTINYDKDKKRVASVVFQDQNLEKKEVTGDIFIFAVPVEVMSRLIENSDSQYLLQDAPTLQQLDRLKLATQWMTGIQFYLREPIPVLDTTRGHVIYFETPWALTSISQLQFWEPDFHPEHYGDGELKSILSVDISNWNVPGLLLKKPARNCTKAEIRDEVWFQLQQCLKQQGKELLKDQSEVLITFFLDRDIQEFSGIGVNNQMLTFSTNAEPLLVNNVNTWGMRPNAYTAVKNLYLASDYVQTFTDLASMEAANEAARRAVNKILEETNSTAAPCEIWDLHEPGGLLGALREIDKKRFLKGEPWKDHFPWFYKIFYWILQELHRWLG